MPLPVAPGPRDVKLVDPRECRGPSAAPPLMMMRTKIRSGWEAALVASPPDDGGQRSSAVQPPRGWLAKGTVGCDDEVVDLHHGHSSSVMGNGPVTSARSSAVSDRVPAALVKWTADRGCDSPGDLSGPAQNWPTDHIHVRKVQLVLSTSRCLRFASSSVPWWAHQRIGWLERERLARACYCARALRICA